MNHAFSVALCSLALFFGMVVFLEIGRRLGFRHIQKDAADAMLGIGAIDGAVFGLLGLLIGFTFSGALQRFDIRRYFIVEESNAIGTAYLRLDMLPAAAQPRLREDFRRYVEARLAVYRKLPDVDAAKMELVRSIALQGEIWTQAVAAARQSDTPAAAMLLLPAINAMINITTTRTMAAYTHPPSIIFGMIAVFALAGSLLAGYGMAGARARSWLHILGFAFTIAFSFYIILDLEYPRLGLFRVDDFDQALVSLRESMK